VLSAVHPVGTAAEMSSLCTPGPSNHVMEGRVAGSGSGGPTRLGARACCEGNVCTLGTPGC